MVSCRLALDHSPVRNLALDTGSCHGSRPLRRFRSPNRFMAAKRLDKSQGGRHCSPKISALAARNACIFNCLVHWCFLSPLRMLEIAAIFGVKIRSRKTNFCVRFVCEHDMVRMVKCSYSPETAVVLSIISGVGSG